MFCPRVAFTVHNCKIRKCFLDWALNGIYLTLPADPRGAVEAMKKRPVAISEWIKFNKLKLKPYKMQGLLVEGTSDLGNGLSLAWDGVAHPLKTDL